jgi:hypothetical protein
VSVILSFNEEVLFDSKRKKESHFLSFNGEMPFDLKR